MTDEPDPPDRQPWGELVARLAAAFEPINQQMNAITEQFTTSRLFARQQRELQEAFASLTKPLFQQLSPVVESLEPLIRHALEQWTQQMPPNWRGLSVGEVRKLIDSMTSSGLALVWIPREEIIREILASPDEEDHLSVLEAREDDVLQDLTAALDEVVVADCAELVAGARHAVEAAQAGHHWAAQALAAATLTSMIHEPLGFQLNELRREFAQVEPLERRMKDIRLMSLIVALARVTLTRFERSSGIPSRFNRHASLHAVSAVQYSRRNALIALMFVVSLLREFQAREVPTSDEGTPSRS